MEFLLLRQVNYRKAREYFIKITLPYYPFVVLFGQSKNKEAKHDACTDTMHG